MSAVRGFVAAVQERYGMRPVVPLEQPIEIGDIGMIGKDGTWKPVSTTHTRFGVAPEGIRSTRDGRAVWEASSGKDVSFKVYARGETSKLISDVADAKARAEITFASSRSFVFAAKGVRLHTATEMSHLIAAIRLAYYQRNDRPEEERWYKDFAFIFAVGDADRLTAILARQAKTTVVVTGRGNVGPPSSPGKLAAAIDIRMSSNEFQGINQPKATGRLYRAYKLKPSVFRRWDKEKVVEIDGLLAATPIKRPVSTFEETFTEVTLLSPHHLAYIRLAGITPCAIYTKTRLVSRISQQHDRHQMTEAWNMTTHDS